MPRLKVCLFGKFQVFRGDEAIKGLDIRKVQELLCYLLLYRTHSYPRETLAGLLWGDTSTAQAKKCMRQTLWQMQAALGVQNGLDDQRLILVAPDWIQINTTADLWLDVAEFERAFDHVKGRHGEELKVEQEQLDILKKRKAVLDARKKDQDALKNQRATSQIAIADAQKANNKWKSEIEKYLDANARGELDTRIGAVDQEIADAEKAVSDLKAAVAADETALAEANTNLATLEAQYADKQKEFNQLSAKIKDVQTRIEKLRAETKSWIDGKDWSHAYYKNYRLSQALAEAGPLLAPPDDPNGTENQLLVELKDLEAQITGARETAATAKTTLETHKNDLKVAEDELKRKKAGLETTIDAFL